MGRRASHLVSSLGEYLGSLPSATRAIGARRYIKYARLILTKVFWNALNAAHPQRSISGVAA